ncbi:MAG: hypothetical protein HQL36_11680, partial [Alphaproteobacteria bacterium]|nr:hypothetical protein [Alphaproteobacteria bacterium]
MTAVLLLTASSASAAGVMSEDCRTLGWHFYCDPAKTEPLTQPETPPSPKTAPEPKPTPTPDPRERIKAIRDKIDL